YWTSETQAGTSSMRFPCARAAWKERSTTLCASASWPSRRRSSARRTATSGGSAGSSKEARTSSSSALRAALEGQRISAELFVVCTIAHAAKSWPASSNFRTGLSGQGAGAAEGGEAGLPHEARSNAQDKARQPSQDPPARRQSALRLMFP